MVNSLDFVYTGKKISYIDLPSIEFFSSYEPTKDNKPFLAALRAYKKIDRTDLYSVKLRIMMLHNLGEELDNFSPFTVKIKETIQKKVEHLEALRKLFDKGILREKAELYNPEIEPLFKSAEPDFLHIKNEDIYDYENNVMLGNYILEAVDPAHRFNLTSYADKWRGSCSKIPFFLYLEEHCNYDLIPQIRYLNDEELKTKKINFEDGKLVQNNKPLTTNPLREFMFIYDADNNFYGMSAAGNLKHTSLSRAKPLKAAGSLEISKGNIQKIALDSGHYFPSLQSIYLLLALFRNNNIALSPRVPVLYHENFQKYITTVGSLERC